MALSQLQCLDDNHVNPRILETKPEFLYCEDQRLALEALLQDGREAFAKFLESRGLRGFLSDPEQETLTGTVEPYDPGSELYPADAEDDEPPLSLQYWPELSDTSVPQMDLGWPDCAAYRGVTRTNVYAQPPLDGQGHIKEIVRKTIAQAQKVIAVVMDVFTDVDIFRDLLDASFKRRVSVYILLERTALPHFLSMCQRANMHAGHLKNLRVRCAGGAEFYTRSCSRVRGRLGHRFMFVDGDRAVSGSYSFTWMSSRLDKHLITVVTGQAVDTFDWLFRDLYMTSSTVDLRQIATETAPEPEPLPQPASVALPSAALARKLYNPKYALVALGNASLSPASSSGNSPKDSLNTALPETKKGRRRRAIKEAPEAPPLHPGLANLEKAYLMPYLPTWPEPDPPSDVIGFINIRDANRPTQVHLQRSERFETSQAIRFSSPFSRPEETLPDVAQPRQFTAQRGETGKVQQVNKLTVHTKSDVKPEHKAQKSGADTPNTRTSMHTPASGPEAETLKKRGDVPALDTERDPSPNAPARHNAAPHLSAHTTVTADTPEPQPLPASSKKHTAQTKPSVNTHAVDTPGTHALQSLPQSPSKKNTNTNNHIASSSVSSTSPSENTPVTTVPTPLLSSSCIPSPCAPPVPKPRTVQLVFKGGGGGLDRTEVSVVARPLAGRDETRVTQAEKQAKTAPELQNNSGTKTGVQTDVEENSRKSGHGCFAVQQTWSESTQEVEEVREEPVGLRDKTSTAAEPQGRPDALITHTPQTDKETVARNVEAKPPPQPPTYPAAAKRSQTVLDASEPQNDGPTHRADTANLSTHDTQKSPDVKGNLRLELRSATPERPRPPTPDSQAPTPDRRSRTPDLRTPTSDVSDGYYSPREDSALSTTSEEYYECSDEPVFQRGVYHSHWSTEDNNDITHTTSSTTTTSSAHIDTSASCVNVHGSTGESTSSSGTESLSDASTATGVSSSSVLEKILKEEGKTNEENGQREEEEERKVSVVKESNRTERASSPSQMKEGGGSQVSVETERTANQERPEEASSGRDGAALGPSGVEKRDRPQAARETEAKKPMRTPPRPARGHHQQQESKAAPQARPSPPSRLRRPYQSSLQGLDNTSPACRLLDARPPAAVGAVGRRQSEVSPSQHSSPYRQPPAVQGRTRAGQTQSQPSYPKPQASFLHTHSNLQSQLLSSQNQAALQAQPSGRQGSGAGLVGAGEAPRQEEGKTFGISFSRLYSLKGLKERMSKSPPQSKRSSTNSAAQGRKSTG